MGDGPVEEEGSLSETGECGDEDRKMGILIFSEGLSRGAIANNGDGVRMETKEVESSGKGKCQTSFWMG